MLKKTLVAAMAVFLMFGCESTDDEDVTEAYNFVTENVKTGPTVYFSFADNAGDTVDTGEWDIAFATFSFSVPINDSTMMTISNPYLMGALNLGVARVDAASLDDVIDVPGSFSTGVYTTIEEVDNWYTTTDAHIVQPLDYVYVVNTDDGKYPAFEVTNYYDDEGNSGVYTIAWKYLSE